jgi:UDP-N-acetylmuramate--alanine ligase
MEGVRSTFTVRRHGLELGSVKLNLAGTHNVLNALAAIAVADELAIPFDVAARALGAFQGVQRRFTQRGEQGGVLVIDDYGHHPAELRATLAAARLAYPGRRVVVLFQPHRYTRTAAFKDDFARAFNDADVVLVAPVYAAGEVPIEGATAEALAEALVRHGHHEARAVASLDDGIAQLAAIVRAGDVVFTQGAGDVTHAGPELLRRLAPPEPS